MYSQSIVAETPEAKIERLELENNTLKVGMGAKERELKVERFDVRTREYERSANEEIAAIKDQKRRKLEQDKKAAERKSDLQTYNLIWPGAGHMGEGFYYRGGFYAIAWPVFLTAAYFSNRELVRRGASVDRAWYEAPFDSASRERELRAARTRAEISLGLAIAVYALAQIDSRLHGVTRPKFFDEHGDLPALTFSQDNFVLSWSFSL